MKAIRCLIAGLLIMSAVTGGLAVSPAVKEQSLDEVDPADRGLSLTASIPKQVASGDKIELCVRLHNPELWVLGPHPEYVLVYHYNHGVWTKLTPNNRGKSEFGESFLVGRFCRVVGRTRAMNEWREDLAKCFDNLADGDYEVHLALRVWIPATNETKHLSAKAAKFHIAARPEAAMPR